MSAAGACARPANFVVLLDGRDLAAITDCRNASWFGCGSLAGLRSAPDPPECKAAVRASPLCVIAERRPFRVVVCS